MKLNTRCRSSLEDLISAHTYTNFETKNSGTKYCIFPILIDTKIQAANKRSLMLGTGTWVASKIHFLKAQSEGLCLLTEGSSYLYTCNVTTYSGTTSSGRTENKQTKKISVMKIAK